MSGAGATFIQPDKKLSSSTVTCSTLLPDTTTSMRDRCTPTPTRASKRGYRVVTFSKDVRSVRHSFLADGTQQIPYYTFENAPKNVHVFPPKVMFLLPLVRVSGQTSREFHTPSILIILTHSCSSRVNLSKIPDGSEARPLLDNPLNQRCVKQ